MQPIVDNIVMDAALPVELYSFTALVSGSAVNLKWQTATEVNNYGFEVQRLIVESGQPVDAGSLQWVDVGFVQGHGNSNSPKDYSFKDSPSNGTTFKYRLKQIDFDGRYEYSSEVEIKIQTPKSFSIAQNFPNPFNPVTTISYTLPEKAQVALTVYSALGEEVINLVNKEQESGIYNVRFDGSNLSSGIYFYTLKAGSYSEVKKMLLVK